MTEKRASTAPSDVEGRFGPAFGSWMKQALAQPVPDSAVAFCFNMYEHEDAWAIGLMGSPEFDPVNDDWVYAEVFEYREPVFEIPRAVIGENWEQGLDAGTRLVLAYLNGSPGSRLRAARAIGIGFVDGELHVIWPVRA